MFNSQRGIKSVTDIIEFFVPLFLQRDCYRHWAFGYVNTQERKIYVFDSLDSPENFKTAKDRLLLMTNAEFHGSEFECVAVECPRQENSNDCGVFALMFMIMRSQGKELEEIRPVVQQRYMNYYRQYLALMFINSYRELFFWLIYI